MMEEDEASLEDTDKEEGQLLVEDNDPCKGVRKQIMNVARIFQKLTCCVSVSSTLDKILNECRV